MSEEEINENTFNNIISSIIDFGGIPLVKYGGFDVVENVLVPVGYQFAGYTGDIEAGGKSKPPLIRENTNLSYSFKQNEGDAAGNWDIGNWVTSNVTNMRNMFYKASIFNQYIGGWNTSKVTDMNSMFFGASNFNKDIGGWVTSSVLNMSFMFYDADSFDQDIGGWDTSMVYDMNEMFYGAEKFACGDTEKHVWRGWIVQSDTDVTNMVTLSSAAETKFKDQLPGWTALKAGNPHPFFKDPTQPP